MTTIKEVAKEAGVSFSTVSRVINSSPNTSAAAVKAVTAAMKHLNYRPNANARALVSQSSNTIGVLVNDVSSPFFGSMVKAIDSVANEHKKQVIIGNGYHDAAKEQQAIEWLIHSRCQSLIVHSKGLSDQCLINFAHEIPGLVVINRHIEAIAERCISLNNFQGSYLATSYLIQQGHQNIGYICSSHNIDDAKLRKAGYIQALTDNNIVYTEQNIEYGEPDEIGGDQAMSALLHRAASLTAVACYNDNMAAGAISTLHDNGIAIPQQVSIIGFDDAQLANYVYPKLTTISYPIQQMAQQAALLSLRLVEGKSVSNSHNVFCPTLVKRQSVN